MLGIMRIKLLMEENEEEEKLNEKNLNDEEN